MTVLAAHIGTWIGTNGFRLMPDDPLEMRPATATVRRAAGGHLTVLDYRWEHPSDGAQDGLLITWTTDALGSAHALWGDSWHQQPEPMRISGTADEAMLDLEAGYGGGEWRWRIAVEATETETMRMLMYNIVPTEYPQGGYPRPVLADRYVMRVPDRVRVFGSLSLTCRCRRSPAAGCSLQRLARTVEPYQARRRRWERRVGRFSPAWLAVSTRRLDREAAMNFLRVA